MKLFQKRHLTIIAIIVVLAIISILPSAIKTSFLAPLAFIVIPLYLLISILKKVKNKPARSVIIIIHMLKIIFLLLFFNTEFYENVIVNTNVDHFSYASVGYDNALAIKEGNYDIYPKIYLFNHPMWWHLNTLVYLLFGFNTILLPILNVFFSSVMLSLLYIGVNKFAGQKSALISMLVLAVFPNFILFSLTNHKDILISTLLLSIAVNTLMDRPYWLNLLYATGLFFLRVYIGVFALVALISYPIINRTKTVYVIIGLSLIIIIGISPFATPYFQKIDRVREQTQIGGSAVQYEYHVSTGSDAILALPQLVSTYVAGPSLIYIFASQNSKYILAVPELLLWYIVLLVGLRGFYLAIKRDILKRRHIIFMLFLMSMIVVFSSLIEANYGTIMRKRMTLEVLMMLFFGLGIKK